MELIEENELWNELCKFDYSKLNNLLKNNMNQYYINSYQEMYNLSSIILEKRKDISKEEPTYTSSIQASEVINFVGNFFTEINPLLANLFYAALYEENNGIYSVNFDFNRDNKSYHDIDGKVNIVLEGTIKDIVSLVHEMMHKFTINGNKWGVLCKLLAESPTLIMEFILYEFVKTLYEENKVDANFFQDMKSFMEWRFLNIIGKAKELLLKSILIKIYKTNNNLSQQIVFDYLNSLEEDHPYYNLIKKGLPIILKNIKKNDYKDFPYLYDARYVVGFLVACYYRDSLYSSSNIDNLLIVCDIMGNSNDTLVDDIIILRNLGFTFFKDLSMQNEAIDKVIDTENIIKFDEDILNKFTVCYNQALRELKNNNNKKR